MRIAFDLDGVLADLHTAFARTALELYPTLDQAAVAAPQVGASPPDGDGASESGEPSTPVAPALPVTRKQSEAIWAQLRGVENFWQGLGEIEAGAIRRLAGIADTRGWEILFITSRPSSAGATVQRQSQRWLQAMGFPLPSVYVVHGSRGRIAEALALDVVVDDRPDNCLDVVLESRAGAVLIWRGPEATVPASARRLGIAVASSVEVCLTTLMAAEDEGSEQSLLDRLRRLFGLRTKSPSLLRR